MPKKGGGRRNQRGKRTGRNRSPKQHVRVEHSAGILVYRSTERGRSYLLLDYGRHWDYPKGHLEGDETHLEAARRETLEETGLDNVRVDDGFEREIVYFFRSSGGKTVKKHVRFFTGLAPDSDVKLSDEHVGFEWLDYERALERLTHDNARELLRDAEAFHREHSTSRNDVDPA